jgi:hypothetical protein
VSKRLAAAGVAGAVLATALILPRSAMAGPRGSAPTAYQRLLQAKVENPDGSPKPGRNPALQKQTSLAAVASRPNPGAGARVQKPAAALPGRKLRRPAPAPTKGAIAGGCATGYGAPGDQCVPLRAPGNQPMTCAYVAKLLPAGIAVTGKDTLRLDTNRDTVACGPGDAGVRTTGHRH